MRRTALSQVGVQPSRLQRVVDTLKRPLAKLITTSLLLGTIAGAARAEEKKPITVAKATTTLRQSEEPIVTREEIASWKQVSKSKVEKLFAESEKYVVNKNDVNNSNNVILNVTVNGHKIVVISGVCRVNGCNSSSNGILPNKIMSISIDGEIITMTDYAKLNSAFKTLTSKEMTDVDFALDFIETKKGSAVVVQSIPHHGTNRNLNNIPQVYNIVYPDTKEVGEDVYRLVVPDS